MLNLIIFKYPQTIKRWRLRVTKSKEKVGEELEEIAEQLPSKKIEVAGQVRFRGEAERRLVDYRFILSLVMVGGFLFLLAIPLYRGQEDLVKTISAILGGPVGAVLGYYFGARRREEI